MRRTDKCAGHLPHPSISRWPPTNPMCAPVTRPALQNAGTAPGTGSGSYPEAMEQTKTTLIRVLKVPPTEGAVSLRLSGHSAPPFLPPPDAYLALHDASISSKAFQGFLVLGVCVGVGFLLLRLRARKNKSMEMERSTNGSACSPPSAPGGSEMRPPLSYRFFFFRARSRVQGTGAERERNESTRG